MLNLPACSPIDKMLMPSAEDAYFQNEEIRTLHRFIDSISEKEREVIELRFGFVGDKQTLKAVSARFGVSIERIRQIEANALRNLRKQYRQQRIKETKRSLYAQLT